MERHSRNVILAAAAQLVLLGPRLARATDPVAAFLEAQADFERGRAGQADANERAHERFRLLSEGEPQNPLFLAYYGSTFAIQGRDAWAPWSKWRLTERGLGLLDKAVAMLGPEHDRLSVRGVPLALETRLVAASTFLGVPGTFNRLEAAKAVLADALASSAFASAPPEIRARLFQQAAVSARREGRSADEADALRHAAAAWPESAVATESQRRLLELGR